MKHCETLDITKNEMDNNIFYFLIKYERNNRVFSSLYFCKRQIVGAIIISCNHTRANII